MKWKHLNIVAFDTETTGLDPYAGDRIIEVALVVFKLNPDLTIAEQNAFTRLINPGIPIPRKVTEITGITDDDVAGKPSFETFAQELADIFKGSVAVAHNYPFDLGFLTQEFALAHVPWHEPMAAIDTVDLSMKHFKDARGHKLGDVSKRLGVKLEGAHRAENDALACGLVLIELAKRHDVADDLQELLDWARAIGSPPEDGPLGLDAYGVVIFGEGPHAGDPVADSPNYLAWMEKAKVRTPDGWQFRYPESTRRWIRRWLNVRGSGRAKQNPKSFRGEDWVVDSCITDARTAR